MSDHYRTIAADCEFRQKIERSEFSGYAFHVTSDEEFFARLTAIQKDAFDATHHCWAFRLFSGARFRSADAGEPSGTAGKPILSAIEAADLHDVAVVVARWYGGVKLGTGGLSRAYRETAAATLRSAPTLDRYLYDRFTLTVPFESLSSVYRLVAPPAVLLAAERFGEHNEFDFDVRMSLADTFASRLTELRIAYRRT